MLSRSARPWRLGVAGGMMAVGNNDVATMSFPFWACHKQQQFRIRHHEHPGIRQQQRRQWQLTAERAMYTYTQVFRASR